MEIGKKMSVSYFVYLVVIINFIDILNRNYFFCYMIEGVVNNYFRDK